MFLLFILFIPFTEIFSNDLTHEEPHLHCTGKVTMSHIVECVLDHSPEFKKSRMELNAIKGRKIAAGYIFPSNPQISFMQSFRKQSVITEPLSTGLQSSINGEILLSQEIYIGGQRKGRLDVADSEFAAQVRRVTAMERETIFQAITATLIYVSLSKEIKLIEELSTLAKEIFTVAKARSEKGLSAPIDTDIAEAEFIRINRLALVTKRKFDLAKGNLTVMMGIPFYSELTLLSEPKNTISINSDISFLTEEALKIRAEIQASDADINTQESKISLLKKERIPNITVSGFVQRDGFNENVIGGRLSLPLKIFRDNSGELIEEISRKEQLRSQAEVSRHTVRFEVIRAISNYNSLKKEYDLYSNELLEKVDSDLESIKKALQTGRINVREALLSQQSLVGLKISYIQSKTDFSLAIAEVIRACGIPFSEYLQVATKGGEK